MKTFTKEEKEQIMRQEINVYSFESLSFDRDDFSEEYVDYELLAGDDLFVWDHELIPHLNMLRKKYLEYEDDRIFEMFIHLLPNSNKVVKL